MAKKKFSRQYAWQLKRKEAGLCPICPKPSEPGFASGLCEYHRMKNRERQRKHAQSKKEHDNEE